MILDGTPNSCHDQAQGALRNVTIPSMVRVDGAAEFQLTLLSRVMTHNVNFIEPRYM